MNPNPSPAAKSNTHLSKAPTRCASKSSRGKLTTPSRKGGDSFSLHHLSAQAPHPAQPSIMIGRFAPEIFRDLGMRKDQKYLSRERFDHRIRHLLHGHRSLHQKIIR